MRFVARYIMLMLCLLPVLSVVGQEAGKACLSVRCASAGRMEAVFKLGRVEVVSGAAAYVQVVAEGMVGEAGEPGCPALPTLSVLVELPKGGRLEVEDVGGQEEELDMVFGEGLQLAPILGAHTKSGVWPGYCPDKAVYAADAWYRGGEVASVERLGSMGEREVYRLTVRPMSYNPVRRSLRMYGSLTVALGATSPESAILDPPLPERYLIVSRPKYREGLREFEQWKRQEGYDVVTLYADTSDCDSVKSLMRPFFSSSHPLEPSPKYVLIVGDASDVAPFAGKERLPDMAGHVTDHPYAEYTGDMLPDAIVGRWPVNDSAELRAVVEKTLGYEQGRDLDTAALRRVLLVAGKESASVAPTTTNGQVNYIKGVLVANHPRIDTLCHYNPASETEAGAIVGEIGEGVGWINYTAHCTARGWTSPAVTFGSIDSLAPRMPALYVNNCCRSNSFGDTCFGEQLLRKPVGGAIGVIGATDETLWNEDYYWAVGPKYPPVLAPAYDSSAEGAFDRWVGRRAVVETQGELLVAGNMAVTAFGSPYSAFYWEVYCLLGDPSLRPYLGVPQRAWVSADTVPCNGDTRMGVAGTPGARVTAVQGDELLGVVRLDSTGYADMALGRPLDTLPLVLTATGGGLQPMVDTLSVGSGRALSVAFRNVVVVDSVLWCTVENTGLHRLDSLYIELVQSGEDSLCGAHIARQATRVGTLLPGATQDMALSVEVTAIGRWPLFQGRLLAWSGDLLGSVAVRHAVPAAYPAFTLRLLTSDSVEVRRLMAGRPYSLMARVEGDYDSIRLEAEAGPGGEVVVGMSEMLAFVSPDSLCRLRISGEVYRGNWSERKEYWLMPGLREEGFEDGMVGIPWDTLCRVPWVLDSAESHSGRYSLRSGAIAHSQTSDLFLDVFLPHADTIGFWAKLSTEAQHDLLTFSVDGVRKSPVLFGQSDWRFYKYSLPAGSHRLRWRYIKDASVSEGRDCVWIDDLRLPMVYWALPVGERCEAAGVSVGEEVEVPMRMRVYPNPAAGRVWVEAAEPMTIQVMDAVGRVVEEFCMEGGPAAGWYVATLPAGVYVLVGYGAGGVVSQRLVILNE